MIFLFPQQKKQMPEAIVFVKKLISPLKRQACCSSSCSDEECKGTPAVLCIDHRSLNTNKKKKDSFTISGFPSILIGAVVPGANLNQYLSTWK